MADTTASGAAVPGASLPFITPSIQHAFAPSRPTPPNACRVDAPLFLGPRGQAIERELLGGSCQGTWAERVVRLIVQLCRAVGLEAVSVSGYW